MPLAWASVETIEHRYFSEGPNGFIENEIEVAILKSAIDGKTFGEKGTWRRTSPDEIVIAFFKAVARRIKDGADEDELHLWKQHMLTVPASFVVLDTEDDISWRASRLRENLEANSTLARTAVQKVFDIAARRAQIGPHCTAKDLHAIWQVKIGTTGSTTAEAVTVSFIDKAFLIWDKALKKPCIQAAVLEEDNRRHGSLFNSVVGMHALVTKSKTEEQVDWVFASILDGRLTGVLGVEHMATRTLSGTAGLNNGKGIVDLMIFRLAMLKHLLTVVVPAKVR